MPYIFVGCERKTLNSINPSEPGKRFGALLQAFRRRTFDPVGGGTLTQARLAELADCGISGTMVGHWENGRRTIKHQDRFILQALIRVLHKYGGIQSLDDANKLLETGLYSQLTRAEIQNIDPGWLKERTKHPAPKPTAGSPLTIILSLSSIYEWLDSLFRWSEADDHARTSRAGMFTWSMASIVERITARYGFSFLSALILWIFTGWLIIPILRWPLDNSATRLQASFLFAACSIIIPFAVSLLSGTDLPADYRARTRQEARNLFLLKLAGAAVGFNMVAVILVFIAVGIFYFGRTLSPWAWGFVAQAPLFMGFIGARRIPADRHKMYEGELKLHPGDLFFLVAFLLIGIGVGTLVYFGHNVLLNQATGTGFLIVLASVALWYRQKQTPIPDLLLILSVGTLAPFLILSLFLFIFPSEEAAEIVSNANWIEIALAFVYIISGTTIWVTLQLRNSPTITLKGALGLLSILLFLLISLSLSLLWGRIAVLVVLFLWVVWGKKRFQSHFWVHASVGFLIITFGLSFFLITQSIPIWISLVGQALASTGLTVWAYKPAG